MNLPERAAVNSLDALRRAARRVNAEIEAARVFDDPRYQLGFVRFHPASSTTKPRPVTHAHLDVVAFVAAGRGTLRLGSQVLPVQPGDLCRVPAGTPHDFAAADADAPLDILYALVRVGLDEVDGNTTSGIQVLQSHNM